MILIFMQMPMKRKYAAKVVYRRAASRGSNLFYSIVLAVRKKSRKGEFWLKQIKYSRQREAIKIFLAGCIDHPTADMIYMAIREEYPNISLGTVYRNLSFLVDRGEILKLSLEGKADRFDGTVYPHYHFCCKSCGAVSDLEMPEQMEINRLAERYFDGKIEGHQLIFYGQCSDCLKEKMQIEKNYKLGIDK